MSRSITALAILALFLSGGLHASAQDSPKPLKLNFVEGKEIDSNPIAGLQQTDAAIEIGQALTVLARYEAERNLVHLLDPPWLMASWRRDEKTLRQQCFRATLVNGEKVRLFEKSTIAVIRGKLAVNRPDLSYHERQKNKLEHFHFHFEAIEPLLTRGDADSAIAALQHALKTHREPIVKHCEKLGLTFQTNFPPTRPELGPVITWRQRQRVASVVISKIDAFYSREPVHYLVASLFLDPATDQALELRLTRKTFRSPPD